MSVEITSSETHSLILQKYNAEWKLSSLRTTQGRSFRTPCFYPVPNMDLKFCFEIFYDEVRCAETNSENSLIKLTLIKLFDFEIPTMGVEIEVQLLYYSGKVFKENKFSQDVSNMSSKLCINAVTSLRQQQQQQQQYDSRSNETYHFRKMNYEGLILKCELIFSGHFGMISDICHHVRSWNNLKDFVRNSTSMQESDDFSDISISIGEETIPAHKFVLAAHSPVLKKMMTSDFMESKTNIIDITDCDVDTFKIFLKYLYAGTIEDDDESLTTVTKLYNLADKYDIPLLKRASLEIMESHLNMENIYEILKFAYENSQMNEILKEVNLKFAARKFAALNFEQLKSEEEWDDFVNNHPDIGYDILAYVHCMPMRC